MEINWKREWPALVAIVAAFAASALFFPRLPNPMPIHWNAAGQPDNFASPLVGAWLLPLVTVGVYLLTLGLPRIDPRRENVERFWDTYRLIRISIVIMLSYAHMAVLYVVVTGQDSMIPGLILAGVGVLFIILGNYMPRMRSNWFIGIRTPWTLSSDSVWRKTHRLGGILFMVAGILMLTSIVLPAQWHVWIMLVVIAIAAGIPIVYSYVLYQQEQTSE